MKREIGLFAALLCALLLAGCRDGRPANTVLVPDDVAGRKIGVLYGTSSFHFANEIGETEVYYDSGEMMDALKNGALDCVIMESGPAEPLASKTSGVKLLSEPLIEYGLSFAIAKENADLKRAVNSALTTLGENGISQALWDKHIMGRSYTYEPPTSDFEEKGTLTLAVPPDFPPYSYENRNGQYTGFDIELAQAVCDILEVGLNIVEVEWKDLITTVQFGKADFALGCVNDNEADHEQVDFSDVYTDFAQLVIVRK